MSFFKRLWATPRKDDAAPAALAEPRVSPAEGAVPQSVERRIRKRINARKGARALIIDDSPTIVAVLRKILRSAGYQTLEALNAETGLDLIRQEKPHLVFLDIILPGMNGFGALRQIRKEPLIQHIPVIMISGNEHATEQFYANRIGADDFMKKPFSRFEVFARIENLLDANRIPRRKSLVPDVATADASPAVAVNSPVPPPASQAQPDQPVLPPLAPIMPPADDASRMTPLVARKELTAMGLQYFDQQQYQAAVERGDKLAIALFVIGGGIRVKTEVPGQANTTNPTVGTGTTESTAGTGTTESTAGTGTTNPKA